MQAFLNYMTKRILQKFLTFFYKNFITLLNFISEKAFNKRKEKGNKFNYLNIINKYYEYQEKKMKKIFKSLKKFI